MARRSQLAPSSFKPLETAGLRIIPTRAEASGRGTVQTQSHCLARYALSYQENHRGQSFVGSSQESSELCRREFQPPLGAGGTRTNPGGPGPTSAWMRSAVGEWVLQTVWERRVVQIGVSWGGESSM